MKKFFDKNLIVSTHAEVAAQMSHLSDPCTGYARIERIRALEAEERRITRLVFRWKATDRGRSRLEALEATLLAHPAVHWVEIGRGRVRVYDSKTGAEVALINGGKL